MSSSPLSGMGGMVAAQGFTAEAEVFHSDGAGSSR
jgi:hypothetical protein